jgi:hypothetical protein
MLVHPRNAMLSAFYDGELSPASAADVEEHLNECSACHAEYRKMAGLANAVRHLPTVRAPASLAVGVRERIDAEDKGMVPVLRGHILRRSGNYSGFFPALSLGTLLTVLAIALVFLLDYQYGEHAARKISSALIPMSLPEPVLLHEPMSSPRFRDGSVNGFPYADVERGKAGTMLTLASIDQNGTVRTLDVLYRSGDEEMLLRTLQAVKDSGFEPARLGNRTVPVNFLYLFTTTEVRAAAKRLTTYELWQRALQRRGYA